MIFGQNYTYQLDDIYNICPTDGELYMVEKWMTSTNNQQVNNSLTKNLVAV